MRIEAERSWSSVTCLLTFLLCLLLVYTYVDAANVKPSYIRKYPRGSDLRRLCPKERKSCANHAIRGRCAGGGTPKPGKKTISLAMRLRQRRCPCTCGAALQIRAQACCYAYTPADFPEKHCPNLCRYNVTEDELRHPSSLPCLDLASRYIYCLWDNAYEHDCCIRSGVSKHCADNFCRGGSLSCDLNDGVKLAYECVEYQSRVVQCQLGALDRRPKWKKDHKNAKCVPVTK